MSETVESILGRAVNAANQNKLNESCGICLDVLAANPKNPNALGLLGSVRAKQGKHAEAKGFLLEAIKISKELTNTTNASWLTNLSTIHRISNEVDIALEYNKEAIKITPNEMTYSDLALTYLLRSEHAESQHAFIKALSFNNDFPTANMGLGESLLLHGEYRLGWRGYAWRNKLEMAKNTLPKFSAAPWNGMSLPDKTIFLVADQGFGDFIQFSRFIPMIKDKFKTVMVGWGPEVNALMTGFPGIDKSLNQPNEEPYDVYSLTSSLPELLDITLDKLPPPIPFVIPQAKKDKWDEIAKGFSKNKPRVGITWAGRPTHPNDTRRSIALNKFMPILRHHRYIDFFVLQKEIKSEDMDLVKSNFFWHDVNKLENFMDTGALLSHLDLVISIDSSVLHFSGALGKPAWGLIPIPNDWRWLLPNGDYDKKSPWYSSVTLFRQKKPDDWRPVMLEIGEKLTSIPSANRLT